MCVFGLGDATGDEAERAVRAGLAMVAAGGTEFVRPSVHAGVEYGPVFITPTWPPAGYGVWGRPVNLAQRLCALAGPGELQVGPEAYARAGGSFASTPRQARLKGVHRPVVAHRMPVAASYA
jgi:class 3 adenylate cyclase